MALVMGSLYEALKSANVPDDLAMEAAAEAARPFGQLAELARGLRQLIWMASLNLVLNLMVLARLLWH